MPYKYEYTQLCTVQCSIKKGLDCAKYLVYNFVLTVYYQINLD